MRLQFKKHFEKFDVNNQNIIRKYYHSLRVMDLSGDIANRLNLTEEEVYIAKLIGLLHDYARFEQWTKYNTYSDIDSIDHGDLAVERLFEDGEIENYLKDRKYYKVIYDAIKYHNKFKVNENIEDKTFCNIIRDADKLDIFYILATDKTMFLEDDNDISREVEDDFYNCDSIDYRKVKNKNDKILLSLAYIFDIKYSFKYIDENNLIWILFDKIKNKEKFRKYFEFVDKYIKERI